MKDLQAQNEENNSPRFTNWGLFAIIACGGEYKSFRIKGRLEEQRKRIVS